MEAVDGDTSPPPELIIAWDCERYHCLPNAGAYLDQDAALITRMKVLTNIHHAYSSYRNSQGAQIHNLSDSTRRVLRYLKDEGLIFRA